MRPDRIVSHALGAASLAAGLACGVLLVAMPVHAQGTPAVSVGSAPPLGLGWRVQAGAVHQFDGDIDGGGRFDATRATIDFSARYAFSEGTSVGASVGYGFDGYGFSSDARIGGRAPWDDVHTFRFALPLFWEPAEDWLVLAIPRLRMSAEDASDWGDGLTGGGIFGFAYRFSDRLQIGPGFGVTSEIEDDVEFFPILVIDWKITDRLRFETGRGLGASRGPGLLLSYEVTEDWDVSVGFRRERQRFRLSSSGATPGGVGEDSSFPVLAGVTWGKPWANVSLLVGVELGGELRIEDASGRRLAKSDYDPAAFVGLSARVMF